MLCESCEYCGNKWIAARDWTGDWTINCKVGNEFWVESPPDFIDIACTKYESERRKNEGNDR